MTETASQLPDFLVIGTAKSGTTSLYRYLKSHPEIYLSPIKEPRYFAFPDDPSGFYGAAPDLSGGSGESKIIADCSRLGPRSRWQEK